jgi:hypothetical protein
MGLSDLTSYFELADLIELRMTKIGGVRKSVEAEIRIQLNRIQLQIARITVLII